MLIFAVSDGVHGRTCEPVVLHIGLLSTDTWIVRWPRGRTNCRWVHQSVHELEMVLLGPAHLGGRAMDPDLALRS